MVHISRLIIANDSQLQLYTFNDTCQVKVLVTRGNALGV
jgi:hypothetical protein